MTTLKDILNIEIKSTIDEISKNFKFKNVRVFFENRSDLIYAPITLCLLVDVDYENGGNANYANYLEIKLTEVFKIDINVMVAEKIQENIPKEEIETRSITINEINEESVKQFFRNKQPNDIEMKECEIKPFALKRRLESANKALEELQQQPAKRLAFTKLPVSGTTFKSHTEATINKDQLEGLFDPDKKELAKEILIEVIPLNFLSSVLETFREKTKQEKPEKEISPSFFRL